MDGGRDVDNDRDGGRDVDKDGDQDRRDGDVDRDGDGDGDGDGDYNDSWHIHYVYDGSGLPFEDHVLTYCKYRKGMSTNWVSTAPYTVAV